MRRTSSQLVEILRTFLDGRIGHLSEAFGEVTMVVEKDDYLDVMQKLRNVPELHFEELLDLCGIDYAGYNNDPAGINGKRFAVVSHLLSLKFNSRMRVRVFAEGEQMPEVPSVTSIWPSANWFEREAFDLYGILFEGHPDLRRILTDYGFVGHPFRKDFPIQGYVEMRYDEEQKRVVYQPVTIEPRDITPRVIRDDGYGRD